MLNGDYELNYLRTHADRAKALFSMASDGFVMAEKRMAKQLTDSTVKTAKQVAEIVCRMMVCADALKDAGEEVEAFRAELEKREKKAEEKSHVETVQ